MRDYLNRMFDSNDPRLASAWDELPFWSAPFGMLMMERVRMSPRMKALDIGCGAGFPLLELAQRLGDSSRLYGIDPWKRGVERLNSKREVFELENVNVVQGVAERLPFKADFFDLIVSNNGLNNVRDQGLALAECFRTLRRGGQFIITYNLPGTMKEFYEVFAKTLNEFGRKEWTVLMQGHILDKRKPLSLMKKMLAETGFRIVEVRKRSFPIRYLDGSAMLHSFFIVHGFLDPWKKIVGRKDLRRFFGLLEKNLNRAARANGGLSLTIPMACLDCAKDSFSRARR